jgi:inward rectifier potassium channel
MRHKSTPADKPTSRPLRLRGRDSNLVDQEEQRQDLGFGTKINQSYARLVNKDGSFNVQRRHEGFWNRLNVYHRLITMGWVPFLTWVFVFYLMANTLFACLYLLMGAANLKGLQDLSLGGTFWGAFFFSAQTLTTVGYGHIAPNGFATSSLAAIESLLGLLLFALATGLVYGRFSRPVAHIRFSRNAIFAPYLDVNGWMFRIIHERTNQLIDVEVEVSLSRLETKPDGTRSRRYYGLPLERKKVAFFPNNWTLVHPIQPDSPLHGCTPEQLEESDAEFLILLRAIDDTFSQMVHTRYSYRFDEVLWGRKFRPMFNSDAQGDVTVDLDQLDETDEMPLN